MTREQFEGIIPALADPTGEIYNLLQGHLLTEAAELDSLLDPEAEPLTPEEEERYTELLNAAVAYNVAYIMVPQLDLVATPTGFGVVSNNNVAPASAHRVEALREMLRKWASNSYHFFIGFLLRTERLLNPEQYVPRLFYSPTDCRAFGIHAKDGAQVYAQEYEAIAADLTDAEHRVQHYIGTELYDGLLRIATRPQTETELAKAYMPVARIVRELVAAIFNRIPLEHGLRLLYSKAKKAAKEYPEEYSEIINIIHRQHYRNEQSDPCYFS